MILDIGVGHTCTNRPNLRANDMRHPFRLMSRFCVRKMKDMCYNKKDMSPCMCRDRDSDWIREHGDDCLRASGVCYLEEAEKEINKRFFGKLRTSIRCMREWDTFSEEQSKLINTGGIWSWLDERYARSVLEKSGNGRGQAKKQVRQKQQQKVRLQVSTDTTDHQQVCVHTSARCVTTRNSQQMK